MNKQNFLLLGAIALLLSVGVYYTVFKFPQTGTSSSAASTDKQSLLGFELLDVNSNPFNAEKLKGKPTLVYFGFTFCPDICPASLNKLVTTIEVLKKYDIKFNAVFITIDPQRDKPATLKSYMKFFSDNIIALTGSPEQIASVAKLFNVYYAKDEQSDAKNYMLNHSSFIYLLDQDGKLINTFSFAQKADDIIEFFRTKLR